MNSLGEKLLAARIALNLTQEQVAQQINVARATIANWEKGRSLPDYRAICKLAEVLGDTWFDDRLDNTSIHDPKGRKMRLKLAETSMIEVDSTENAVIFNTGSIDLHINGSDSHGYPVDFHISANFCVENDDK